MAWLDVKKAPILKGQKRDAPENLWQKCGQCLAIIFRKDFEANQNVCIKCQHHYPIAPLDRLNHFLDQDTFQELDKDLRSSDPLKFVDSKSYAKRIEGAVEKLGVQDDFLSGKGLLHEIEVQVGVFDFRFMGGSMGSVVGEKIARIFIRAGETGNPAIIFSASGGARMQEGILSLMQMAKTCAALSNLKPLGIPFISVMTNPTTGGVAASYSMLGDVNIGEPGALIGFAGPRVIQQTIGQSLPEGFQRSEYLLEHGMLDMICHRDTLRDNIGKLLRILTKKA